MFICDECTDQRSIRRSQGPCEVCGTVGPCNDIPSSAVRLRASQPSKAESRLEIIARALDECREIFGPLATETVLAANVATIAAAVAEHMMRSSLAIAHALLHLPKQDRDEIRVLLDALARRGL